MNDYGNLAEEGQDFYKICLKMIFAQGYRY